MLLAHNLSQNFPVGVAVVGACPPTATDFRLFRQFHPPAGPGGKITGTPGKEGPMMERLTELLRNLRVRTKFLLILLLATALVSAAALGAVHIPMKAYDNRLYQSSAQTIALFAEQIQSELQDFEAI